MLRKIRICIAIVFFVLLNLVFLDFTGILQHWIGWTAKIQFLPAILALNVGVIIGLVLLTLLFGRIYCSVICPLGFFQDIFSGIAGKIKKNRFHYSPNHKIIRYSILAIFIISLFVFPIVARLIEPYSAYGRIAANLLAPLYQWCNNVMAYFAERADSYAFYSMEVWMKSLSSLIIAIATFVILAVLAVWKGRVWCNNICPVGTILGFLSRFAWFKPVIDTQKCVHCGKCAKNCKGSCINVESNEIDYSRCVVCMDCLNKCSSGAIHYQHPKKEKSIIEVSQPDESKRKFMAITALFTLGLGLKAQAKKVDGGLAIIEDKMIPNRKLGITPAGSKSVKHFAGHCTSCQLCVSACPNQVLRPSNKLENLMQPEMSYERGYCRPECTRCSEVCPTGAIQHITPAEKSSIQIGHAVWIKENCRAYTQGRRCGHCASHCPVGAIQMVPVSPDSKQQYVVVNTELCIGCGACENLCPSRPLSAIYVEGNEKHRCL